MIRAKELFNIGIKDDSDVSKILKAIEQTIEQEERYKELISKAKEVFDLSKLDEAMMFSNIERLARVEFLRPAVSVDDYERTVRFVEDSIKNDKFDIIQKFLNFGRGQMSDEDMEQIMRIKDRK